MRFHPVLWQTLILATHVNSAEASSSVTEGRADTVSLLESATVETPYDASSLHDSLGRGESIAEEDEFLLDPYVLEHDPYDEMPGDEEINVNPWMVMSPLEAEDEADYNLYSLIASEEAGYDSVTATDFSPYFAPKNVTSASFLANRNRELSSATAAIGTFLPLECNSALADAPCIGLQAKLPAGSNPLVVPCGVCYVYDLGDDEDVVLTGGIHIKGLLKFPPTVRNVTITTPSIIVEGELEITSDATTISPENESVTFNIVGTGNVVFVPLHAPNIGVCGAGGCNLGPKPFFVAGGKVNIRGFPNDPSCATHTPILDKRHEYHSPDASMFPTFSPLLSTCPVSGIEFIRHEFDEGSFGNWTGWWGGYTQIEDNALKITNRHRSDQGPYLDITSLKPGLCFTPGQVILFSTRIKLDMADGSNVGLPTTCKSTGQNCPSFGSKMLTIGDVHQQHRDKSRLASYRAPNYGEWFDWTGTFTWDENELSSGNNAWSVLYMYGPEEGVDISVDTFRIDLPSEASFANQDDVCGELVANGDAEANGFHPYPVTNYRHDETVHVLSEGDNQFFRVPVRGHRYSSFKSNVNTECMQIGVKYFASIKVRIHSESDTPYFIYLFYSGENQPSRWDSILECPGQRYSDGWVTCSGEFTVNEYMDRADDMNLLFHNSNGQNVEVAVDFDDISITQIDYVESLIVKTDDAQCWGVGSEIHVGTSAYHSFTSRIANSYSTVIKSITDNSDGTSSLGLAVSPTIPIISKAEDDDFAADVALLSRNFKVISGTEEDKKGAYLQVLHTPDIAQIIEGVEFDGMGRAGEEDRYPLQLLYSGSVEGTRIDKNTILRSNMRCIAIQGTGNATVSNNIAALNKGHCIYVGFESQDNLIQGNLVSETTRISWQDRVSPELDDYCAAFRNRYGPNDYIANKAVGSYFYGFQFDNSHRTNFEDKTHGPPNPRHLPLGKFSQNEARSNGDAGMHIYHHEQSENIFISNLKSIKNRHFGLYAYNVARLEISGSLFAESVLYNVEFRWSDEMTMTETDIRGISSTTKNLAHPSYFEKPCKGNYKYSPVGYRMQAALYRNNNVPRLTRGARLSDVHFSLFDQPDDDACSDSVPISFNSVEKRDGHWDYLTSFANVTVDGIKMMDAKVADESGIPDIVITDPDGSSDPSGLNTGPGSFVSNKLYLKKFAGGDCSVYHDGIAYCQNTCYRTLQLKVGSTGDFDLRVTKEDDGAEVFIPDIYPYDNDGTNRSSYHGFDRIYSVSLPAGAFKLEFLDEDGIPAWPRYVYEVWEGTPDCEGYGSTQNLTIAEPELECDDMIMNGNMEKGTHGWLHNNNGEDPAYGYLEALPGIGIDGSMALGYYNRNTRNMGVSQDLDTRCFHENLKAYYEVKAWFRLEREGEVVICNPFDGSYPSRCPQMTLKNVRYLDPTTKDDLQWDHDQAIAKVATPNTSSEFNLLHGVIEIGEKFNVIQRAFLYIEHFEADLDIIVDDFSITKMETGCSTPRNLLYNTDFTVGDSRFWTNEGVAKFEVVDQTLKVYGRTFDHYGIAQYIRIDRDCLNVGDRYMVRSHYRLEDSGGNTFECDPNADQTLDECPYIRMRGPIYTQVGRAMPIHPGVSDGWNMMTGIFTLNEASANYESMFLEIEGAHKDVTIVLNDVSFEPLPKTCDQSIVNPSFDDGSAFAWNYNTRLLDISVVEAGEDDNYALRFQHDQWHYYLRQEIDTRCIVEGQEFLVSAKFQLLNATSSEEPVGCDRGSRNLWSDENLCPVMTLRWQGCEGADIHTYLWNQKEVLWDKDIFNDHEYSVQVDAYRAACEYVTLEIGLHLPLERILLIDDVMFSQKTTFAPTASPTFHPTKTVTTGPTLKPTIKTDAPTTSTTIACPSIDGEHITIDAGDAIFTIAESNTLCTISMFVTGEGGDSVPKVVPLARSYDLNEWEVSAGPLAQVTFGSSEEFLCYDRGCQIHLPPLDAGAEYRLTSRTYTLSPRDQYSRFLETASFGATATELDNFEAVTSVSGETFDAIASHVELQMDEEQTPITSHREFWRKRANPRQPESKPIGTPNHPCDANSRWRRFTFARLDGLWYAPLILRLEGSKPYVLKFNGIFRTVVEDLKLERNANYTFSTDYDYELCGHAPEDGVGKRFSIKIEDGTCWDSKNPAVSVDGHEDEVAYILDLPDSLISIDESFTNGDEFILPSGLSGNTCDQIPRVAEYYDEPIFGKLPDGSWLQFDPRLSLQSNTLEAPLPDGGKGTQFDSRGLTQCSNTPRTFLNEDTCFLSDEACQPSASNTDLQVLLEDETLRTLYELTDRYVYSIIGLNVVDQYVEMDEFPEKLPHPCTASLRSRWTRKEISGCDPTELYPSTSETLTDLLSDESDRNPYIRDIYFPETGLCNATDTDPSVEIIVGDTCWERVHHDYLSIYDMTYWVTRHPGSAYHITKWAEEFDSAQLMFPNGNLQNNHPMSRWDDNYHKFSYVGRYGDTLKLRDLPNDLRTEEVNNHYLKEADIKTSGVLVCGSPGEVVNDKSLGFLFDIRDGYQTGNWGYDYNKMSVWLMASLDAPDQLRQRVAWGLAQILVVVRSAIGDGFDISEWFLSFYDIFVRNAFGNYRDILKEISYNPLMAENLSFLNSKSSAYVWERYRIKAQADENFAREIMQLFSMGLIQLNLDGSPKLNDDGETALAYTNEDIMSLSRVWTGFNLQPRRGNLEGRDNRNDPMKIEVTWRDKFPKSDTTGGYIGDYYPLCEDLPNKAFLKMGATYRFLGSSSLPELMSDPSIYRTDENTQRVVLDENSLLRNQICNPDASGKCQYSNTVILPNSINACVGIECDVGTLRVVQIEEDAFYEYIRAPCVNQAFFNGAKKISPYRRSDRIMCGNPTLMEASGACCSFGSTTASVTSKYDGERLLFESAKDRCKDDSKSICDFNHVSGDHNKLSSLFFWTPNDCQLRLKVKSDGMVTIVHKTYDDLNRVMHLEDDNENWFKVYWEDDEYPKATNGCDGVCEVINGDTCLCGSSVEKGRGFRSQPSSVDEMLETLFIGSFDPLILDPNNYIPTTDPISGITSHVKNEVYDSTTIFEYNDDKGRRFFVKNTVEKVQVRTLGNLNTGYSFRNAPQFMSFVPAESTLRDAQYETEATLDHYFYHDNTAPFLSTRLIQRLISSNPSPRYVKTVATAFKEGTYDSDGKIFGSGKYGDMAAMFAAIYLDREARTLVLDADPSSGALREPLLKVVAVMRSMNFQSRHPLIRLGNVRSAIGQMVHDFESVFSFFLPEFEPYGRVGDASLTSPEATILDMPRIVGMLNGLTSLAKYGLSNCEGGFGTVSILHCSKNLPSPHGVLEFNRTSTDTEFSYETFEGASLNGGLDNIWVGRNFGDYQGTVTKDPQDSSNNVFHMLYLWHGTLFSQPVTRSETTVVKFQYLGTEDKAGGCIGISNVDARYLVEKKWIFCDSWSNWADNVMESNNNWISCQFEVPSDFPTYRIALADTRDAGDAYFDNIQVVTGTGTFCHSTDTPVTIEDKSPPGVLGYSEAVVNELATLLTAGRLSEESRQIIKDAYDSAGSANDGLRVAQELIMTSAEFHSTNFLVSKDEARETIAFPPPTGKPYKAVVYVMFNGGCDSYNMLMPHTCPDATFNSFMDIRAQVAIPKSSHLPIDASEQVCSQFGLHPNLPAIQSLYNDNDLMFFANTGVMTMPVDKTNYYLLTNTQLFAHNLQQLESKRIDPYDAYQGTGVLGRMADLLDGMGHNVGSFSVDRFGLSLVGSPGVLGAPMIVNNNGVPPMYLEEIEDMMGSLHNSTVSDSGFFGETWSNELMSSLATNTLLSEELEDVQTDTEFPPTYLSRQFETVSRLIKTRESRGVDTDTFYVEIFGYDTHSNVEEALMSRFSEVNEGYEAFAAELKAMGLWDNVVTIQTSDFARTLNPNSGDGTDHAWGGNYMMMGGSVKGGQVAGHYPDDFSDDAPLNIGRGRMIPTTPWDAVFKSIASWLEIPRSALDQVCPNLKNFDESYLFDPNDLFEGIPPPPPTASPSSSPIKEPSSNPTEKPSRITEEPSLGPSQSSSPSANPAGKTSSQPTNIPSVHPSINPSGQPSSTPSSQPSATPSDVPSSAPSSKPVATSTDVPTSAPVECKEQLDDDFFLGMRNGQPNTRNCEWLKKKSQDIINDKCEKTAWYDVDGVTLGPPQVVCPVTCGTCTPPVTAFPSSSPVPCTENKKDKYFLKVKDGKIIKKTCKFLQKSDETVKANHCKKTESKNGFGPAQEVCRVTCETCP